MTEAGASAGRLRWKCRRGMRELDVLLTGFLEQRFPELAESGQANFADFLELQDPEIWAYLLGRTEPEAEFAEIVRDIRDFSGRRSG